MMRRDGRPLPLTGLVDGEELCRRCARAAKPRGAEYVNRTLNGRFAPHLSTRMVREADRRIRAGQVSLSDAARELYVSRGTLWKYRRDLPPEPPPEPEPVSLPDPPRTRASGTRVGAVIRW
jgi:hypothetical protein